MEPTKENHSLPEREQLHISRTERKKSKIMKLVLQPLAWFLNGLYFNPKSEMTGLNKVYRHNVSHAWKMSRKFISIDFEKLQFSKGTLPNAVNMSMCSTEDGSLFIQWTDNSGIGQALATDKLFILVNCDKIRAWVYAKDVTKRSDGYFQINLRRFSGMPVVVHVGFLSEDRKRVSDNLCLGTLNIM